MIDYKKFIESNFFKDGKFKRNSQRASKYDTFFEMLSDQLKIPKENRSEMIFNVINPTIKNCCVECGNPTKFIDIYKGYRDLCSNACQRKNHDVNQKRVNSTKRTLSNEFGVENVMQLNSVKNKVSKTIEQRYGSKWYVETTDFKRKFKISSNEKYGTDSPMQNDQMKEAIAKIIFEKYDRTSPRSFHENRIHHFDELKIWCSDLSIVIHDLEKFDFTKNLTDQTFKFTHSCGHSWEDTIEANTSCLICHKGSKVEQSFKEWAKTLDINIKFNDRTIISPLEIDVYFPDNSIGIEINGLYWHCDEAGKISIEQKTSMCTEKNVQLISIWEHEWMDVVQREKIKNLIKIKLGLGDKLYARKLKIKELTTNEEREFLNAHHLQNYTSSSHCYGLVDNSGNVKMLLSIKKSRYDKKFNYELIRLCSTGNEIIIGGLNKLMAHVDKNALLKNETILTYCDRRFGTGKGYISADFKEVGVSRPNYIWWKHKTFLPRGATMKKNLSKLLGDSFSYQLTEKENMNLNGWKKLSDAGNLKFVYTKRLFS